MSEQTPPQSDQNVEGLTKRVDALDQQANDLVRAFRGSASTRRTILLLLVVILVVFGYMYYARVKAFTDNADKLMAAMQTRADANLGQVMTQVQQLADNTWPTVSVAFADQFQSDMPKYMKAMAGEWDKMSESLQLKVDRFIEAEYHRILEEHRAVLEQEFPEVEDPDAFGLMIANFEDALKPMIKEYYGDKLAAELTEMDKTWDDFPQAKDEGTPEELADQLYQLLFEMMRVKIARLSEEQPAT